MSDNGGVSLSEEDIMEVEDDEVEKKEEEELPEEVKESEEEYENGNYKEYEDVRDELGEEEPEEESSDDVINELSEEDEKGGLPKEDETRSSQDEDDGWHLPHIDPDGLYEYAKDKTPELSAKAYNQFETLWDYFKANSVGSVKGRIAYSAMKKILEAQFERVNKVELWTILKTGELPDERWEREGDTRFPSGTVDKFKKLDKVVDVEGFLVRLDQMLEQEGGELVMLILKDVRPDIFRIIKKNNGEWMAWKQARILRQDLRYLIQELRRSN